MEPVQRDVGQQQMIHHFITDTKQVLYMIKDARNEALKAHIAAHKAKQHKKEMVHRVMEEGGKDEHLIREWIKVQRDSHEAKEHAKKMLDEVMELEQLMSTMSHEKVQDAWMGVRSVSKNKRKFFPKSKSACKKRHMKWKSQTKKCTLGK